LYETDNDLFLEVTDSILYAVVIGEEEEFCRKLRNKGVTVLHYGSSGDVYGQTLLSHLIGNKDLIDAITGILQEQSLHLSKIYTPISPSEYAHPHMNESVYILRDEYDDLAAKSLLLDMIFNQERETDILHMVEVARSYYYQL